MKSKFDQCLKEMLSTVGVGVGSANTETNVNPTNDDSYARGDARLPTPLIKKKKRRKKKINESFFKTPLKVEESFNILRARYNEKDFKTATSILLDDKKPIEIKSHIVTEILGKHNNPDITRDDNTFNLKNIFESIKPHLRTNKVLVIGSYEKNNKLGVTWVMV